jgi:hypothetical protein
MSIVLVVLGMDVLWAVESFELCRVFGPLANWREGTPGCLRTQRPPDANMCGL